MIGEPILSVTPFLLVWISLDARAQMSVGGSKLNVSYVGGSNHSDSNSTKQALDIAYKFPFFRLYLLAVLQMFFEFLMRMQR